MKDVDGSVKLVTEWRTTLLKQQKEFYLNKENVLLKASAYRWLT